MVYPWPDSRTAHPPRLLQEPILCLHSAPQPECHWCEPHRKCDLILPLSLWLRRLVLKGNKGGFKADFPKNDMLFYSRKQPKEQEAAEDKTSLQMSAHGDVCRHLLGEKGGAPPWLRDPGTCWHSDSIISWRTAKSWISPLTVKRRKLRISVIILSSINWKKRLGTPFGKDVCGQIIFPNRFVAWMEVVDSICFL